MRLASVRVDRYGPLAGIEHAFDGGLEVVYGPNESGKTLLLEALLRLCSPDVVDAVPAMTRVDDPPVGHAVLERNGDEHVLGDGTAIGDLADVTPRQLRNVFVVRDADLRLAGEHAFYDATARRLADLHTAELEALREKLVTAGRITPETRNLSTAADERDEARVVRDEAATLAGEMRAYVRECRERDVETAERERLAIAADLERARTRLARQRAAETLHTHLRLSEHLETVRAATEELGDRACTAAGLERLEAIERELASIDDDLEAVATTRDELRATQRRLEERRDELRAELDPLEDRASDAEAVRREVAAVREGTTDPRGSVRLGAAVAGLVALGAGLAAGGGATIVGRALAGLAAAATAWTGWRLRATRRAARDRATLLQSARDAGLAVESVADVAPAIREVTDEAARVREELRDLEQELAVIERRLGDRGTEREELVERRRELRRERREHLRDAGVPDVDTYRERVERAGALRQDRETAAASLAERLGEPEGTAPGPESGFDERIAHWEAELAALRDGVERGDASPDDYDPDALERLEGEVDRLEGDLADRRERLADHRARIDGFADDLAALPTGRFRDEPIQLSAQSVDGLATTAAELEALVDDLERDADVARAALSVLADVRAAEEAKLAELFGPESRASAVFRAITDGRYAAVTYDPEDRTLVVRDGDGDHLTAAELSRGATDQLYLAARVGLAERLCPGEPGFLLLDDALLPADPERLQAGFDALRSLAAEGWQVVYWTAKPEVGETLVEAHDLPCREFERL